MPNPFTPWVELFSDVSTPSAWTATAFKNSACCYFFDGVFWNGEGDWTFNDQVWVEHWALTGGANYFYLGYIDAITHPITPPGDFVVEAVVCYYYRKSIERPAYLTARRPLASA